MDELKKEYIEKLKRLTLLEAGFDYSDVDNYVKYLKSDDKDEMKREALALVDDIKAHNTAPADTYHAPRAFNPFKK